MKSMFVLLKVSNLWWSRFIFLINYTTMVKNFCVFFLEFYNETEFGSATFNFINNASDSRVPELERHIFL